MYKSVSFLVIALLVFSSCKKFAEKRAATVTINFQTEINQTPFKPIDKFTDSENREISLELIKFYLADLVFINEKGKEIEAEEIALIELDINGTASFETKVKAGDYTAIKFGIGVPKDLNESDPDSFSDNDHPLNVLNNTYWGMNSMYRFVMIDGRYFEGGVYQNVFSYHSGHNDSYRTVQLDKAMSFDKKTTYNETIFIDISKILEGPGGNMDIVDHPNYHGNLNEFYLSEQLSDNFSKAFRF